MTMPERHGYIWSKKEINQLERELKNDYSISKISHIHKRTNRSISLAIEKYFPLYLEDERNSYIHKKPLIINYKNYDKIFKSALDYVNYRIELA